MSNKISIFKTKPFKWFCINTIIAFLIYLFGIKISKDGISFLPFRDFILIQFSFHTISSLCAYSGYMSSKLLLPRPYINLLFLVLPITLMMTLPGITLVAFLQAWILQYPLKEVFFSNNFYVAVKDTVLITATITVITSRLEYLEYEKRELNTIIKNMDIEKEANPPKDTKKQRSYWESCERLTI